MGIILVNVLFLLCSCFIRICLHLIICHCNYMQLVAFALLNNRCNLTASQFGLFPIAFLPPRPACIALLLPIRSNHFQLLSIVFQFNRSKVNCDSVNKSVYAQSINYSLSTNPICKNNLIYKLLCMRVLLVALFWNVCMWMTLTNITYLLPFFDFPCSLPTCIALSYINNYKICMHFVWNATNCVYCVVYYPAPSLSN